MIDKITTALMLVYMVLKDATDNSNQYNWCTVDVYKCSGQFSPRNYEFVSCREAEEPDDLKSGPDKRFFPTIFDNIGFNPQYFISDTSNTSLFQNNSTGWMQASAKTTWP